MIRIEELATKISTKNIDEQIIRIERLIISLEKLIISFMDKSLIEADENIKNGVSETQISHLQAIENIFYHDPQLLKTEEMNNFKTDFFEIKNKLDIRNESIPLNSTEHLNYKFNFEKALDGLKKLKDSLNTKAKFIKYFKIFILTLIGIIAIPPVILITIEKALNTHLFKLIVDFLSHSY